MPDLILLPLAQIQPSQLYISKRQLTNVLEFWDAPRLEMLPPIPVRVLDGQVVATDGHARAFAAHRCGFDLAPIIWDEDDLDVVAYRVCVGWCLAARIHTVMDLEGRHLEPEDYDVLWLERCVAMHGELSSRRRARPEP